MAGAALVAALPLSAGIPVPAFSSRPGAPYTLYLNFGGFDFTGDWYSDPFVTYTPGFTPAFSLDSNTTSFTSTENLYIRANWQLVADKYSAFNINVTTVDPAVAAGRDSSDFERQEYYDETPGLMHTVIGGNGSWIPGAGGVSFVDVIQYNTAGSNGLHTNWVFSAQAPSSIGFVGEATAHEIGHAFGLLHQCDCANGVVTSEYSTNNSAQGNGSFAPTMGVAYSSQRGLFRSGFASGDTGPFLQNDFDVIGNNAGIELVDSGIGHTRETATTLPLNGTSVDSAQAKGMITPTTLDNPNPIGVENYTKDYFAFFSIGQAFTISVVDGIQGVFYNTSGGTRQYVGATLDGTLTIFDEFGNVVATGISGTNTTFETFSGTLPAGNYYLQVASVGGYTSGFDPTASYFTSGSYHLTGTSLYTKQNLVGVNLSGANLSSQNLSSANLRSANLTSTNLSNADLTDANLSFTDLRNASGFSPTATTDTRGAILPDGSIESFSLLTGETLLIRQNSTMASLNGPLMAAAGSSISLQSSVLVLNAPVLGQSAGISLTGPAILELGLGGQNLLTASSLSMSSNAVLSTNDNDILINYSGASPLANLLALLASGQIVAQPVFGEVSTLMVFFEASDFGLTEFAGLTIDQTTVIGKFTYTGDANLDGQVDAFDYSVIDDNFGNTGSFISGDLNQDGFIDAFDYSSIDDTFGAGIGNPLRPGDVAAFTEVFIPEPSGLGVLALAGVVLTRKRA